MEAALAEFVARVQEELDYELEADAQRQFATAFADDPALQPRDVLFVDDGETGFRDTGDSSTYESTDDVQTDADRLADERARYAELWGEAAAAEEFDRLTARRELTPAEQRQQEIWEQAEQLADVVRQSLAL